MLEKLRKPAIIAGLLGAIKLATDAFGFNIIADDQINAIANGFSAVITIIATLINRDNTVE
jgi:hypothetical protein